MDKALNEIAVAPPVSHRRRRFGLGAALLVALAAVGLAWYARRPAPPPEPPAVDLAGADDEVVHAVEDAQQEVRKTPRSARAWGDLGMVLAVHSYRVPALAALAEAERLDPTNPRWPYFAGLTLQPDSPARAIPKFRRALELSNEPAVAIHLAQVLLEMGSLDEAEALFQQAERADPADARAALGLAQVAHARGKTTACLEYARRAGNDPATRKAAHSLLAETYAQLPGRETDVERERQIVAGLPEDGLGPDPYFQEALEHRVGMQARIDRANALLAAGHGREALDQFQQALAMYPNSDWVWLAFGVALSQRRDYPAAEQAFRKAIALGPNRFESRYQLGYALYQQRGRRRDALDEAVKSFREGLRLFPTQPQAHLALGWCLEEQGNWSDAAATYRQALACRPDFPEAHRALAKLMTAVGEQAAAAGTLQRLAGCPAALDLAVPFWLQASSQLRYALQFAPRDPANRPVLDRLQSQFPYEPQP